MHKIAIYCRVSKSPDFQNPENQLVPLRNFANSLGGTIVGEYIDHASGGNSDRINFLRMLEDADKRRFSLLIFWSLDRLTREGISNTLGYLQRLKRNGIAVKSLQESWLDTRDEGIGDLLLAIFSWIGNQERQRIKERTLAGLRRAVASGKKLGRPVGSKDKKRRRLSGYLLRYAETFKQSSP